MIKYKLLTDFRSAGSDKKWEVVNDEVMGGLSKGRIEMTTDNTGIFGGRLSLENNGGFVSVRTFIGDLFLDGFKGVAIRVKGDGRRYRFRLGTAETQEGFAYQCSFATQPDTWLTEHLPFSDFEPFFRGNIVPNAPALNYSEIRRIGLMIADGHPGSFRLEIEWIKAYLAY